MHTGTLLPNRKSAVFGVAIVLLALPLLRQPVLAQTANLHLPQTLTCFYPTVGEQSYAEVTLGEVPPGFDVTNGHYLGWCLDYSRTIDTNINYCDATLRSSADPLLPEHLKTGPLGQIPWGKINFILNNKRGRAVQTVQDAIWFLVEGQPDPTPEVQELLNETLDEEDFQPESGEIMAVILDLGVASTLQRLFIEVRVTDKLELVALEVTQTIQDWSNSVPVIQDKRTWVRTHLQLIDTNTSPVRVFGARLRAFRGGAELMPAQTPLNPVPFEVRTNNAAAVRGIFDRSLNFSLPADWRHGLVELRFEWTNGTVICREPAEAGGVASNCAVQVMFVPSAVPQVKFVAINWTNMGVLETVAATNLADLPRRLVSIYPIDRVEATFGTNVWSGATPPNPRDVNNNLRAMRVQDGCTNLCRRLYYGAIATRRIMGASEFGGTVGSGYLPPISFDEGRHTHSHEIGHVLGRHHATDAAIFGIRTNVFGTNIVRSARGACGEVARLTAPPFPYFHMVGANIRPTLGPMDAGVNALIYGLDTLAMEARMEPVVDPTNFFDLMSYCSLAPTDLWISKFTYEGLLSNINTRFGPMAPALPAAAALTTYLIVRGSIDFLTDQVSWLPFFNITTPFPPESPPPGEYTLLLLDVNGQVLQEIPFAPIEDSSRGEEQFTGGFLIPVLADPAIEQVVVVHHLLILASLTASVNPPTVQVLSPNGAENFGPGLVQIAWQGNDIDGDALSYSVQYSPNGGAEWDTLVADWIGQSYLIDTVSLKGTTMGLMRVIATDGFHSTADESDAFFGVKNHAPTIVISAPRANDVFNADQQVCFEALANDLEEGVLPAVQIQWTSSLDGLLGSGASLQREATTLSEGQHLIALTATDSAGLQRIASVSILVFRGDLPILDIARQGGFVILSWPASLTNYSLQSTPHLSPPSWTTVTNAPAVMEDELTVTLNPSTDRQFFRLRKP